MQRRRQVCQSSRSMRVRTCWALVGRLRRRLSEGRPTWRLERIRCLFGVGRRGGGDREGRLNVKLNIRPGYATVADLRKLGVARISVGPELFGKAMSAYGDAASKL